MADFIESEAEESEQEEEIVDRKSLKKSKHHKISSAPIVDSSEEDEEDDEEQIREELKDLIDDNPIDEEESDSDKDSDDDDNHHRNRNHRHQKRKKSDDELDDRLEDDDYDLIEENLGMKVERRKFKRLKRIEDEESDGEEARDDGQDREAIALDLFSDDEDRPSERHPHHPNHRSQHKITIESEQFNDDEEGGEYSDADDFIVDDDGRPIAEKRKRRPVFTDTALQEAQETFGVDFDFEEFSKYDQDEYEEDDDEDEDEEDEYEEDELGNRTLHTTSSGGAAAGGTTGADESRPRGAGSRSTKKKSRGKPSRKSIFEVYEPSELKRGFFTDLDNEIRTVDMPERMLTRDVRLSAVPDDSNELDLEAEWIYKQAFTKPSISNTDSAGSNTQAVVTQQKKGPETVGKIRKALDFMRNQQLEVPFIAFYRKEYVQPELNINDLWRIYKFDARWCQLCMRKGNVLKLLEKMRTYQTDEIMKDPDAPLPDGLRLISDVDIERVNSVQTLEELQDIYHHFVLYYSVHLTAMHQNWRRRELARKREEKRAARLKRMAEKRERNANERNGVLNDDDDEDNDHDDDDKDGADNDAEPEQRFEGGDCLKYANRCSSYTMCVKAGVDALARRFGLTPEQFAENLRDNYQRHDIEEESADPMDLARDFICKQFGTVEEVLQAAKYMVAIQIAREPLLRSCVREVYFERAKLSVQPTKKGLKVIDEAHNCYTMKFVKDKPVQDLSADQFLKLCMAEEEHLVTLTFSEDIVGNTSASYVDEVKQLYHCEGFSKIVQNWNALRAEAVERALVKCVLPDLRAELRRTLLAEAKDCVLKACCRKLYNWLKVAPYTVTFPEEWSNDGASKDSDWNTSKGVRTMGVAYVPDFTQAAFACIAAPDGEITDYLRLPHLLKRKNSYNPMEKALKESDLVVLRNFIAAKKPHVIVVGGESRDALTLAEEIRVIIQSLPEGGSAGEDDWSEPVTWSEYIKVEVVDNELAKVYANSNKGCTDYREYPELLRQAVSLARLVQDPLVEFSGLCNGDDEILSLRFHTLQEQLPKEELLEAIRLEFVNRTNEVGVDLNVAVQYPHKSYLVQFVCGLGPRKSQALLRLLKQTNQRLENRTQLVTACHMGPKVFINCSGFIKIDTTGLGDSTEAYVEILDGTRVHPETYEWARKMAVDALEYDDDEEANPAGALEEILMAPERLKDLDLDAFAEELERQGFGNKSITLYDIRAELNSRYKDLRTAFRSANAEELFDMLTKETPDTFYQGKLVTATVVGIARRKPASEQLDQANPVRNDETGLWQCPFCLKNDFPELADVWNHFDAGSCPGQAIGIKLRLDSGISGYIHIKNLSDSMVTNPEERVKIGQLIHCRISKIDVERFSVDCTSKSSDLLDKNHEWRPARDFYYDQDAEEAAQHAEQQLRKSKQALNYVKRVIVHPAFHNISYVEAEKCMMKMDQGEVIIRPSSKGANHLTITWKVTDGILQHIDVREEGKTNAFSLGKSLWIGTEEFEDLDEIIARHVTPMANLARDLLSFRYYRDCDGGQRDKTEEFLKDERKKNPSKIHYVISAAKFCPGKFLLSYMPRTKVRHEFVTVTADGYRFRQQIFETIPMLFKWFKDHFRDPIPGGGGAGGPGSSVISAGGGGASVSIDGVTPNTPGGRSNAGGGSLRNTPFQGVAGTPNSYTNQSMNPEAIQRVAQNLPSHMMQTLTAVASQTPHYMHTPGGGGGGFMPNYVNTPYTPSGQTPFMTPYHTPHSHQTPRPYNQQMNASHHQMMAQPPQQMDGPFMRPVMGGGGATPSHRGSGDAFYQHPDSAHHGYHHAPPPAMDESPRSFSRHHSYRGGGAGGSGRSHSHNNNNLHNNNNNMYGQAESTDWQKAAEAWASRTSRGSGGNSREATTSRHDWSDNSAGGGGDKTGGRYYRGGSGSGSIANKSPRSARSTPHTNASPHSMSLGDATPLYDESI